ncbi:MAG: alkyl/aryl-sulfatase [Acidobacteriota bacterium]|nr:alkyl/aryl-sulfatase [Acidobacteriota bacterium]
MRIIVLLLAIALAGRSQYLNPEKALHKVTDHVYVATGYALGNVIYVITDRSVVVVDTTESPRAAQATLDEFRKISPLPVSYIVYTHFHGDHINGAKVFRGAETKIIAQRNHTEELRKYVMLGGYNARLNAIQFGSALPEELRGAKLAIDARDPGERGYIPPSVLFDEEYKFEEGGTNFELYHTIGETFDHLMVWLPRERVLLPGDLFYESFPMLASPMKPDRPVPGWATSLDRMRKLRPGYLVPSHTRPQAGADAIDTLLANYARAIRFVHDETVKRINQGLPLERIRAEVQLPDDLAKLPYLQPGYGTVPWSVNGIYKQYTGWYDFDPADLNPPPRVARAKALLEAAGGPTAIIARARKETDPQLIVALLGVLIDAEPGNRDARALRADAFEKLGKAAANTVERNIYLLAAHDDRK